MPTFLSFVKGSFCASELKQLFSSYCFKIDSPVFTKTWLRVVHSAIVCWLDVKAVSVAPKEASTFLLSSKALFNLACRLLFCSAKAKFLD